MSTINHLLLLPLTTATAAATATNTTISVMTTGKKAKQHLVVLPARLKRYNSETEARIINKLFSTDTLLSSLTHSRKK